VLLKPVIGITDFITKILESIAISINDVLGDRVRKFARYQRNIKDNRLTDYNSLDALAYTVYKHLSHEKISNDEEIHLALPGKIDEKERLMLFTNQRIFIVQHDDNRFISRHQIHLSECQVYHEAENHLLYKNQVAGKKLGFINEDGKRFLYIYFDTVGKNFGCMKKDFTLKVQLNNFDDDSLVGMKYRNMIDKILSKHSDNEMK
jgi:hypothetical protein